MKIIFPSKPFEPKTVDDEFAAEKTAAEMVGCQTGLFDFDLFRKGKPEALDKAPHPDQQETWIYRGWMLKPSEYEMLFDALKARNIVLLVRPSAYLRCHLYPLIYSYVQAKAIPTYSQDGDDVNHEELVAYWSSFPGKKNRKLYVKDWVKSAKNVEGATVIENYLDKAEVLRVCNKLREHRGESFIGGYVFKQFVDMMKRPDGKPEEYRGFFYKDKLFSWAPTHGNGGANFPPPDWANEIAKNIPGDFYTLDFGFVDGKAMIIEAGDGGVSGLSPDQLPLSFYEGLKKVSES